MKITIDQILAWDPCVYYDTREKIIEKTDSNWPKTPLQIAHLDIPARDRMWVLLRPEIIPEYQLHLLACDFAEEVLPIFEKRYPNDKRPRVVIETKRKWVAGEVADEELDAAAADAAAAAVYAADAADAADAAYAAYAAADAAYAAADAAYAASARAADAASARAAYADAAYAAWETVEIREKQLQQVIDVLEDTK